MGNFFKLGALAAATVLCYAMPGLAQDLKIVLNRNTSNLAGFLASDQGLYKKHGADVEVVVAGSGAESNELLASGRVDGGTLGLGPSVIAWANGLDLVPLVKYRDGAEVYSIIVRKDAGISKIEDLKGKRVAVTKGTDPETAFILALKAHGVDYTDVQVLDSKWADHAPLLDRGDVVAVNANEPFGSLMVRNMSDKVQLIERLDPYYGNGGFMLFSQDSMNNSPEAVRAVVLAYWEAHQLIRTKPEMAIETLKTWLNLDDEIAKETIALFGARPLLTERTLEDLKINADLLSEAKKIRSVPDIDAFMARGFAYQDELGAIAEHAKFLE